MPDVAFDRFYRYDELTEILQGWAEEQPELFRVESIGKSYEDRDIWLATVTNFDAGLSSGASMRAIRRSPCWQRMSRPCRSSVEPFTPCSPLRGVVHLFALAAPRIQAFDSPQAMSVSVAYFAWL